MFICLGVDLNCFLFFKYSNCPTHLGRNYWSYQSLREKNTTGKDLAAILNVHIVVEVLQCPVLQPLPSVWKWSESVSSSAVSNSLRVYGLYPTRLLCLWDSPGRNTGVGCNFLLQGIFPMQKLNSGLLDCRQILYHLICQRSLQIPEPNNDKNVKDQRDSPSLSSGSLLATRVKTSPSQVIDTWALARALVNNINKD